MHSADKIESADNYWIKFKIYALFPRNKDICKSIWSSRRGLLEDSSFQAQWVYVLHSASPPV